MSSQPEINAEIRKISSSHEDLYLCQFLLNCHHQQDAVKLLVSADHSILGGILCDGVSESPLSGIFAKFLVEHLQDRIFPLIQQNPRTSLTTTQVACLLNDIVEEFYEKNHAIVKSEEISPKSTFILYLYFPDQHSDTESSHMFFYLGDGKIVHWNSQSVLPPAEFLLEYHNETGALLNAVRKDLKNFTKNYPISKILLTLPVITAQNEYLLFASDGLEPYFDDLVKCIQKTPNLGEIIHSQQNERFQSLILSEVFENLKILPNDDVSFILAIHERK